MGLLGYSRRAFAWFFPLFIILFVSVDQSRCQGLPFLPGTGSINWGWARITPEVQIGYQKLGLNFNMPAPIGSTLDLQLRDANLWTGSLAAVVDSPFAWSFVLRAQANAKRNVTVFESQRVRASGHGAGHMDRNSIGMVGDRRSSAVSVEEQLFCTGRVEARPPGLEP